MLRLLPGGAAGSPNVMFSNVSALAFDMRLQKSMNYDRHFFDFSTELESTSDLFDALKYWVLLNSHNLDNVVGNFFDYQY